MLAADFKELSGRIADGIVMLSCISPRLPSNLRVDIESMN